MIDILRRVMVIIERIRNMSVANEAVFLIFAAIAVFGVVNCILGYRLLRFWMMLFGFCIGATLGVAAAYTSGMQDKTVYVGAMVGLGVILAVVAFLIYKAGIFMLGAGIGLVLSIYVLHPTTSFMFFLCILFGAGLGVLAMRWAREVIIIGTSLLGGVAAGVAVAKITALPQIPYGIGMSAGFALLGMMIQFLTNKVDRYEEDEEEYLNGERNKDQRDEDAGSTEDYI